MSISKELLSEVLQKEAEIGGKSILGESYVEYKIVLPGGEKLIRDVNIHELAFRTRDYFKTKNKHLSLNQSIEDIFNEANSIYESLSSK